MCGLEIMIKESVVGLAERHLVPPKVLSVLADRIVDTSKSLNAGVGLADSRGRGPTCVTSVGDTGGFSLKEVSSEIAGAVGTLVVEDIEVGAGVGKKLCVSSVKLGIGSEISGLFSSAKGEEKPGAEPGEEAADCGSRGSIVATVVVMEVSLIVVVATIIPGLMSVIEDV